MPTFSFLPNNAFSLPSPLTPKLLALGLDGETARTVSTVYLSAALALKQKWEAEYTIACHSLVEAGDDRGYGSNELREKLLNVSVARYSQALSSWLDEVIRKAEASVLQRTRKCTTRHTVKKSAACPPSAYPGLKCGAIVRCEKASANTKSVLSSTGAPRHAFPRPYPPPVRPEPTPFVTRMPQLRSGSRCEPRTISDGDFDVCIEKLSRLSLGQPTSRSGSPHESSNTVPKSQPRTRTPSILKPASQLSPSRPRPVSPKLDTSVAVSHKSLSQHTPPHPSSTRSQNIDIPRSDRRKASSIPYQRPTVHASTSPDSLSSSYFSRRTPSLVSDHGSEASSPSTPPEVPSVPIPTSTTINKDPPEAIFHPEQFLPPYSEPGWQHIDFGTDLYG